jgi:hypothetical protein
MPHTPALSAQLVAVSGQLLLAQLRTSDQVKNRSALPHPLLRFVSEATPRLPVTKTSETGIEITKREDQAQPQYEKHYG